MSRGEPCRFDFQGGALARVFSFRHFPRQTFDIKAYAIRARQHDGNPRYRV